MRNNLKITKYAANKINDKFIDEILKSAKKEGWDLNFTYVKDLDTDEVRNLIYSPYQVHKELIDFFDLKDVNIRIAQTWSGNIAYDINDKNNSFLDISKKIELDFSNIKEEHLERYCSRIEAYLSERIFDYKMFDKNTDWNIMDINKLFKTKKYDELISNLKCNNDDSKHRVLNQALNEYFEFVQSRELKQMSNKEKKNMKYVYEDIKDVKIDVYDVKEWVKAETDNKYIPHMWDNLTFLVSPNGKGMFADYEGCGENFANVDSKIEIPIAPYYENGFSIFATGALKTTPKELMEKASKKTIPLKDFFTKYKYNPRCERNFREVLKELETNDYFSFKARAKMSKEKLDKMYASDKESRPLIDGMKFLGNYGFDICDTVWDYGIYFETDESEEKCDDYHSKFNYYLANKIHIEKYVEDYYSHCQLSKFINDYRDVFEEFCNSENDEGYQPKNYTTDDLDIVEDDSIMIDIYLPTLGNLMIGNYAQSDYKKILNMCLEYDKKKEQEVEKSTDPYVVALKQVLDANKKENLPNIDFKTETMLKHGIKPLNNGNFSKKQVFNYVNGMYKANGGVEDIKPQTAQELQEAARKQFEQDVQKENDSVISKGINQEQN